MPPEQVSSGTSSERSNRTRLLFVTLEQREDCRQKSGVSRFLGPAPPNPERPPPHLPASPRPHRLPPEPSRPTRLSFPGHPAGLRGQTHGLFNIARTANLKQRSGQPNQCFVRLRLSFPGRDDTRQWPASCHPPGDRSWPNQCKGKHSPGQISRPRGAACAPCHGHPVLMASLPSAW